MKTMIDDSALLNEELSQILAGYEENLPENVKVKMQDQLRLMEESDILDLALKKGDVAPDFCLPDSNGNMVSSADLRSQGPLVVVFFRGNWCSFCNATLRMIRKYTPYFRARGATIVAISPLSKEETSKTVKDNALDFPVLSDVKSEYSQLLNIAFVLDDAAREISPDLAVYNDDDSYILPIPATYVIEADGRVSYSFLETNFTVRAEPVDILNALPPLKKSKRRSLEDKIQIEVAHIRDRYPRQSSKIMQDEIEKLKSLNASASALRVGDKAPDFKLYCNREGLVDSKKLRKQGPLVVTFYHGLESPICMITLETIQKYLPRFEAKGATVVAIAPPVKFRSGVTPVTAAKFPLLCDPDNKIAEKFGVSYEVLDYFGGTDERRNLPMAATFVIDSSGKIIYSFVDVDPTKRADPRNVLKAIPAKAPKSPMKERRGPFSFLSGRRMTPMVRKAM